VTSRAQMGNGSPQHGDDDLNGDQSLMLTLIDATAQPLCLWLLVENPVPRHWLVRLWLLVENPVPRHWLVRLWLLRKVWISIHIVSMQPYLVSTHVLPMHLQTAVS